MRYFTRELYEHQTQNALGPADEGFEARVAEDDREWTEAGERYLAYLQQHDAELTDAVRKLKSYTLHDALITRVLVDPQSVTVELDTRHAPLIERPSMRIVFQGVQVARGLDGVVGETVLYEELYIHEGRIFEFSALCRGTEFRVRFKDVIGNW